MRKINPALELNSTGQLVEKGKAAGSAAASIALSGKGFTGEVPAGAKNNLKPVPVGTETPNLTGGANGPEKAAEVWAPNGVTYTRMLIAAICWIVGMYYAHKKGKGGWAMWGYGILGGIVGNVITTAGIAGYNVLAKPAKRLPLF